MIWFMYILTSIVNLPLIILTSFCELHSFPLSPSLSLSLSLSLSHTLLEHVHTKKGIIHSKGALGGHANELEAT